MTSVSAQAEMISFMDTVSQNGEFGFNGNGTASTNLSLQMSLSQFDASLGTLTGVSWTDEFNNGEMQVTTRNTSPVAVTFVSEYGTFGTSVSEFPGPVVLSSDGGAHIDLSSEVNSSSFKRELIQTPWGGSNTITLLPSQLTPYIGTGFVTSTRTTNLFARISDINFDLTDVTCVMQGAFGVGCIMSMPKCILCPVELVETNASNFTRWSRTVNYTYETVATSVPAPSTLAIFALGLMGLGARRFKKQS